MWGQWRGHLILRTALRVRWPGPSFRGGETEAQRDQNPSTLAEKAVRVDGKNDSLLGTQRVPRLPLEVGKSEWKRPETPCWRSPTPHQAPPGPAHTLGRGPRPQVRCLLPLTRAGRVETRPLAFGGVWSTPCARHAPLWLAHSHPRPSMGREDVLPLPDSAVGQRRTCTAQSEVLQIPAPPTSSQCPPEAGGDRLSSHRLWPPSPTWAFPRYPVFLPPFQRTESAQPGC